MNNWLSQTYPSVNNSVSVVTVNIALRYSPFAYKDSNLPTDFTHIAMSTKWPHHSSDGGTDTSPINVRRFIDDAVAEEGEDEMEEVDDDDPEQGKSCYYVYC